MNFFKSPVARFFVALRTLLKQLTFPAAAASSACAVLNRSSKMMQALTRERSLLYW